MHLSDCICLTLPSLYISNLILALRAMLQVDLPHVNVLSKIDKIASYGPLPFNLDFYTEVQDLTYLLPHLESEAPALRGDRFSRLNRAVAKLVEDFGLVSFEVLAVEDRKSMTQLLRVVDRAGGYVFGGAEGANDTVWQVAMRNEGSLMEVQDVQERWIDAKDEYDEAERREWEEQAKTRREEELEAERAAKAEAEENDMWDGMPPPTADSGVKVVRKNK